MTTTLRPTGTCNKSQARRFPRAVVEIARTCIAITAVTGFFGLIVTASAQSVLQSDAGIIRLKHPLTDRSRLPQALQKARLERLSSGALTLLSRDGDLVEFQTAPLIATPLATSEAEAAAALDPRVGTNIRLGNDPPVLPPATRAQAEPDITRSLSNPRILLATFQEGRFTTGGAADCGFSVSGNGGLSWSRALIPNLTQISGGPYFAATDPVAASDAQGNLYLCALAATDANFNTGVIVVSRSTNDGTSFSAPRVAYRTPNNTVFPDKEWMAINTFPGTPTFGRIVVTLTLFRNGATAEGAPIVLTYSDDAGITWSTPKFVHSPSMNAQGSQPVFLPSGKLAIVYWNFGSPGDPGESVEVVVSNNGGITFGAAQRIAHAVEYNPPNIRSGAFLPSATADRMNGNLYVVYQASIGGAPRILFTKSSNEGRTWTPPVPITDNRLNTAVFNPAISASAEGQTLSVAFYDNRANPGTNTLVDIFLAPSFDGGATWQRNIRLSSVSTNAALAPLTAQGYMLGDYLGIAEALRPQVPAVPVWIDTRTGNPDPFITRVAIAPIPAVKNILWQNSVTGERQIWIMSSTLHTSTIHVTTLPTEWNIAAYTDFNGDGKPDIVWQNSVTGQCTVWYMDLGEHKGSATLPSVPMQSEIVSAADFDGDGETDLLLQNDATGRRSVWLMSGTTRIAEVSLGTIARAWKMVASGDFNGDGKPDILWQNNTPGERLIWLMNGTTRSANVHLGNFDKAWDVVGTGEFNGDGRRDILWQNKSTGERLIWLMSGTTRMSNVSLGTISLEWGIRNH